MLLEDDTAFQPGFGRALQQALQLSEEATATNANQRSTNERMAPVPLLCCRPEWGRLHFGYGYSGVVLHSSDASVYQQIHYHFYDELPCDVFGIHHLLGDGEETPIASPTNFSNGRTMFLKHLGNVSTLKEKIEVTW